MPKRVWQKLTHPEILELFRQGKYFVDLQSGTVSNRQGRKLRVRYGSRGRQYPKVRLHSGSRRVEIGMSHVVWLAGAGIPIPTGFEIHHKDTNPDNNAWPNLFCLYELDHRKLHNGHRLVDEPEEDEPF